MDRTIETDGTISDGSNDWRWIGQLVIDRLVVMDRLVVTD
jgi:hypothetical protein